MFALDSYPSASFSRISRCRKVTGCVWQFCHLICKAVVSVLTPVMGLRCDGMVAAVVLGFIVCGSPGPKQSTTSYSVSGTPCLLVAVAAKGFLQPVVMLPSMQPKSRPRRLRCASHSGTPDASSDESSARACTAAFRYFTEPILWDWRCQTVWAEHSEH